MGHTTSISDYELDRGDGPPPCEGYDIDAEAAPANGAPTEEEEVYLEDLTVAELKAELDSLGVKYPSTAHKADLVDLLAAQE